MLPIPADRIRDSFINATLRERKSITPPAPDEHEWQHLDYLGWRDPKQPQLGYIVVQVDGEPVGVILRQAERSPRSRAQCSWCEDVQLPNDVVFFSAKRAGDAGRRGDTLGTLVCSNFECSVNVRRRAPMAYVGFDVEAARAQRIAALRENVRAFVTRVAAG
ncbi:MAG TPA: FBP domain-containing protein [Rhodoglobus sp.]|nr:FBP domain-containing protein [Rhodoglobus sp.]